MARLLLAPIVLLAGLGGAVSGARAASPAQAAVPANPALSATFASVGWDTQDLTGQNPTADLYLPGPGPMAFGPGSTLFLTYGRSPLIDPRQSSLSVSMNDVAIASAAITSVITEPTTLAIRVPPSTLIGNGYNHLHISFGLRDRFAQACGYTDPALNVTLYGTSRLVYDVLGPAPAPFQPDLAALPAPFVAPGASVPARIAAGLAALPTAAELTAAARLIARLAEDVPATPPTITTVLASALPSLPAQQDLLIVGTPSDNPAISHLTYTAPVRLSGGLWRDLRGRALPADEGLILETANPWDPRYAALTLTANGQEGIARAATVLGSGTLRHLLHGSFALLPRRPQSPPLRRLAQGTATLADLGYAAALHEGLGEHVSRYSFDLARITSAPATFTLVYGHSATLAGSLSSVRIDLNGQPLASRPLAQDDPPRVRWQVSLPADVLRAGTNLLSVHFFLQAPGADCQLPPYGSVWAAIDAGSTLSLPHQQGQGSLDLSALPFPIVRDGDPSGTTLIVPAKTAAQYDALDLAALIGAASTADAPQLTVLPDAAATHAQLTGRTVVLDGMRAANRTLAGIAAQLPLRALAADGSLQIDSTAASLDAKAEDQGALGVVEEMQSPWDAAQSAVVISATNPDLLPLARRAAFGGALSGTAATVDDQGRVQTFDTALGAPEAGAMTAVADRPVLALSALGLGLFSLLVAGVSARRLRRMP